MATMGMEQTDKAEESLNVSQVAMTELADLKFALDQHAIVAITDVQGTIRYVNDKFCAISQYSKDELIGQDHRILNSGYHPKEFFQQMYHAIGNGKVWHDEISCARVQAPKRAVALMVDIWGGNITTVNQYSASDRTTTRNRSKLTGLTM